MIDVGKDFDRLLEIVLPEGRGYALMLEAYFDESERESGVFCVAGYAFAPHQARKFSKEWRGLFGQKTFHMVDLAALRGEFEGLKRKEANRLLIEAIKIINKRISFGVAVSCHLKEVAALSPTWIRGFGHAYPICCHLSMWAVGDWLRRSRNEDRVAYFFESGHPREFEAREFIKSASHSDELKDYYHHDSDTFIGKHKAPPLGSADLLAWEWAKCQDETIDRQLR